MRMSNIINFPEKDFLYITGNHNEPDIVGVHGKNTKLEFAPNLHDFIIGGEWVYRDELIALVLATGLYDDIKKHDN